MAKIFITGSSDGLGFFAAKMLLEEGHHVVLHARNESRKQELQKKLKRVTEILVADLSDIEQTKQLATKVNSLGKFDAIIHNAGVYNTSAKNIFKVNVLAPYILSALIKKPKRLIYISSDMHLGGNAKFKGNKFEVNSIGYSDSKLFLLMLCKALAIKWPDVYVNALHPGWVPTKMGGEGAPDNLEKGFETQVWLATSGDEVAKVSGQYFFHKKQKHYHAEADDREYQKRLISICNEMTDVELKN